MRSLEENWEVGVLVTAEAVFGIGFPPAPETPDITESSETPNEAAD